MSSRGYRRGWRPCTAVGAAGLLTLVMTQGATPGTSLYRCVDTTGASVFTDSPVQLQRCEPLKSESSEDARPSPPPSRRPPPIPSPGVPPVVEAALPVPEAPNGDVTVPVERVGNLLIIAARINGTREARLILDTGASHTILAPAVAADLGLFGNPQARSVTLKTAGGPVEAEIVQLESIELAEAQVRDSAAAIYELPDAPPGVEGLLGLTFLRQFQVTLDSAGGLLHLRRPGQR